jgi:hypothetical protein
MPCSNRNSDPEGQQAREQKRDLFHLMPNDERMHHYQRRQASITGLMVELRKIIETGRLVVVVMTRLVSLLIHAVG